MDYIKYIRKKVGHQEINLTGVNVLIINEKEEILLQKRGTYPYKWGLIGGVTDLGESLEETAIREAKEETGLDVYDLKLLGTTSGKDCYVHFPNNDKAYFITIAYYTNSFKGTMIIDGKETVDLQFFNYESLPEDLPKMHRKMINIFHELRKKS